MIEERELILEHIYQNKKLDHWCLKKEWYKKKNILHIFNLIFFKTSFLDEYDGVTLRERIFYIEKNYTEVQLCPICIEKKLKFRKNLLNFTFTCCSERCKSKRESLSTILQHKNMSKKTKEKRQKKISIWQSRPLEEKHGKETADRMKEISRKRLLNMTYEELLGEERALEEKQKRRKHFTENNPMFNSESKRRGLENGKKTRRTPEYIKKIKEIRKISGPKQGESLKKKILSGEYTPRPKYKTKNAVFIKTEEGDKRFRSNWEAGFWTVNPHLEYEKVRISYIEEGKKRVYIVDFVDKEKKILYEVKPNYFKDSENTKVKIKAALEWCVQNLYTFELICEEWFFKNINLVDFEKHPQLKPYLSHFKKINNETV